MIVKEHKSLQVMAGSEQRFLPSIFCKTQQNILESAVEHIRITAQ